MGLLHKLFERRIWKRISYERLTEPIHLNVIAGFIALFGGFRHKVAFDLVFRPQHAFGLLHSADRAVGEGRRGMSVIEFGVGNGEGLLNMCDIARRVMHETGVKIRVFGFDTGSGLPVPRDFRDHPELYIEGQYQMREDELRRKLPEFATLIIGDITETVPDFIRHADPAFPIAFASLDVDYYWSAKEALRVFSSTHELYLHVVTLYVDDIQREQHNRFCGEYLAIEEFNREHRYRKIDRFNFLEQSRIFRRAPWLRQMYTLHVLDHPIRQCTHELQPGAIDASGRVL